MSLGANPWSTGAFLWKRDAAPTSTVYHTGTLPDNVLGSASSTRPQLQINYTSGSSCSGQPPAGVVAASDSTVCPPEPFLLSLTGVVPGNGISIQWESSPASLNNWNPIATSVSSLLLTQSSATDYRAITTCGSSSTTSTSNVLTISMNANCYCLPSMSSGGPGITHVGISGTTLSQWNAPPLSPFQGNYNFFPPIGSATGVLSQGYSYTVTVNLGGPGGIGSIWIDYNHNGVFESSEWTQTGIFGPNHIATFTVPLTAVIGQTGVRVRAKGTGGGGNGANDACTAMTDGATADFTISIVSPENNLCEKSRLITSPSPIMGTTANATQSIPAGTCATTTTNANDVWYLFVTNSTGAVTVAATNTTGDIVVEVFSSGNGCSALTEIACLNAQIVGTEAITFPNLPAGTYFVRVYGYLGSQVPFTIQVTGLPLDIDLIDIACTPLSGGVELSWNTASEAKGDFFELEKSQDGQNFSKISSIEAVGKPYSYDFFDGYAHVGINYYRLKMINQSGMSNYSRIVSAVVKAGSAFGIEVFPNPVDDRLNIAFHGARSGTATITILDITGKMLMTVPVANTNALYIEMGAFPKGTYLLKYSDAANSRVMKINKK